MIYKLIIPLILLNSIITNAQTDELFKHKFVYQLIYQTDSTDVLSKKSEEFFLFTNNDVSIFQSKNGFIRDSILSEMKNIQQKEINSLDLSRFPKTQFNYKIIKNNDKDSIIVIDKIFTDNFQYKEDKRNIEWSIKSDTLTVNNIKCQKATTYYGGRFFEAWFSYKIPITDGPYKFKGLPGLIIKISDSKNHYVFELIAKQDIDYIYSNIKPEENLYITSKSIFLKKLNDYKNNIFERMELSGFNVDDSYKRSIKERLRKRNNPIELKENDE